MYFKVINKESEVYQKLHAQRTLEIQYDKENIEAIKEKVGSDWSGAYGKGNQSSMSRVYDFAGFVFNNPENLDSKAWKLHKEHKGLYIPNRRTKKGKEIDQFLMNGLKGSFFTNIFDIIGFENYHGQFRMPFLDLEGDTILLYIDDRFETTNPDIIEITKTEFETIRRTIKA